MLVERLRAGDQLMGPDSQSRTVSAGSVVQGRAAMFSTQPGPQSGADVTGDRPIVLVNNTRPAISEHVGNGNPHWTVFRWEVDGNNSMRRRSLRFFDEDEAYESDDHQRLGLLNWLNFWESLFWTVSLDAYYGPGNTAAGRKESTLTTSSAVSFVHPRHAHATLRDHLTAILGEPPTTAQEDYMAWLLGLWIADGKLDRPYVVQGGSPQGHRHCHHEVFDAMESYGGILRLVAGGPSAPQYARTPALFPGRQQDAELVTPVHTHDSPTHNPVCDFQFTRASVFWHVLCRYRLVNNKHIPDAILCDALEVRQRLLAGLMDGDGHFSKDNTYEINAKEERVIKGYPALARSCGTRVGNLLKTSCKNADTGEAYEGYKITLSGAM